MKGFPPVGASDKEIAFVKHYHPTRKAKKGSKYACWVKVKKIEIVIPN
jgi:hypothetical protein